MSDIRGLAGPQAVTWSSLRIDVVAQPSAEAQRDVDSCHSIHAANA